MKHVLILGFLPLAWCVREMLAANVTEKPFSIDANPNQVVTTTDSIKLFLPENSQVPTTQEIPKATAKITKTHSFAKDTKQEPNKKQQTWQIPSPLSPLATSDPKATNSSKRQTGYDDTDGGEEEDDDDDREDDKHKQFVPSQQLGSFDNTEGFVPHVMQPKFLNKPNNYGYSYGESRLPSPNRDLQSFEHDLDDLKAKYPELNDLANNYPIMEEIVKQKLAERFQHRYSAEQSSEEKYLPHVKFPSNSGEDKSKSRPYQFEHHKWKLSKNPFEQEGASTAETPFAGQIYQEPKLPVNEYLPQAYENAKNNASSAEIKDQLTIKPKKSVSPWKKVLHLVTAFLPVGLLISALTPNVINISSVPNASQSQNWNQNWNQNQNRYPIRQRSEDDRDFNSISSLVQSIRESSTDDPECDDRRFCEISVRGKQDTAQSMEKLYWNLAHSTPDNIAETVGMKKLFKAVRNEECSQFACKKLKKRRRLMASRNTSSVP